MIAFKLGFAIIGLYAVYILAALLNQQIFSRPYQNTTQKHKHYFYHADLLQVAATLLAFICSRIVSQLISDPPNPIPLIQKFVLGVLYTNGVSCLNYALYYVPFSVRTLFDSFDYLITVFISIYLSRYSPHSKDRLGPNKLKTAFIISIGSLLFIYYLVKNKISQQRFSKKDQIIGYLFLGIALIGKGFFIDSQSYNKSRYRPTQQQILYTVNFGSFIVSLMLLVVKKQLHKAINFCVQHPTIVPKILYFAVLSAIGQQFIYYISYNFSVQQNMIPLISTTRKILSLVVSLFLFGGSLNLFMIIGLVLTFGGMIYELVDENYYFLTRTQPKKKQLK